jgi:NAD(P)-dependent dehydrogenase (short-subunit alcohol dehydrogenase family)
VDMTDDQWGVVIDVTLNGTFRCTRAALQHMQARGSGVIVNNASVLGWRAQAEQAHYAAAKAGVMALTRSAAMDLAPLGIRVNAVSPAMTETPHTRPLLTDPDGPAAAIRERVPLRRWGQPEDVANAILFLASAEAAHVSGANIPVDGGAAAVG